MEKSAIFSPDGRFIAYVSNESGSDEIYVQPFPGPGEIVPVSAGGGRAPVWSHDGRELYYRNGSAMMTVSVTTEGGFRAGRPRQLFEGRYGVEPGGQHDYDVSPDGQRFLMVGLDDEAEPSEIRVVLSWFEEVERLAPAP
jgi:serine/threonine-protein kinase